MKKNNRSYIFPAIIVGFFLIFLVFMLIILKNPVKTVQNLPIIDGDLSPAQTTALYKLASTSTRQVAVYADENIIRTIDLQVPLSSQGSNALLAFLNTYQELFNISDPTNNLILKEENKTSDGYSTYRYSQNYEGIPVFGSDIILHVDPLGNLVRYNGGYASNISISTSPTITRGDLAEQIGKIIGTDTFEFFSEPELIVLDGQVFGSSDLPVNKLVWNAEILTEDDLIGVFVDANSGELIIENSQLINSIDFEIFDAKERDPEGFLSGAIWGISPPGNLVMNQDGSINDEEIQDIEALNSYNLINIVVNYFENLGYEFPQGKDGAITAYINVGLTDCPNAKWFNANRVMFLCNNTTKSSDIIAHEMTHGISGDLVDFAQYGKKVCEPNAVNEAYSDIFAMLIDTEHPYQICLDDCITDENEEFDLIRDIADPSRSYAGVLPINYNDLVKPGNDICPISGGEAKKNGCGHRNSTILSHVVYLLLVGGEENNIRIDPLEKGKVEHILIHSLLDGFMSSNTDLKMAADANFQACKRLIGSHGITSQDCNNMRNAFGAAGLLKINNPIQPIIATPSQIPPGITPIIAQPTTQPIQVQNSQTVLVMDVSGSMSGTDTSGIEKMSAAKKAARNLLEVIGTEQTAFGTSSNHQVGLVSFSDYANTEYTLTEDVESVRSSVDDFYPMDGTAMAAGLQEGLSLFDPNSSAKQILVLMGDGVPTTPIDDRYSEDYEGIRNELIGIAEQAGRSGVCVYTVGFGDPNASKDDYGYIDADLLQSISDASGCGQYFNAANADQLANIFLELRHTSLGTVVFSGSGPIQQDEVLEVGSAPVPDRQKEMLFTLNWPGSKLQPELFDPRGRKVTEDYPGATVSEGDFVTSIVILDPSPGQWRIAVVGINVPNGTTTYNVLMSTRAGGSSPTPIWLWTSIFILGVGSLGTVTYIASTSRRRKHNPSGWPSFLLCTNGYLKGNRIPLGKKMIVGRGPGCQIALRDLSISRQHAQIILTREGWIIQDLHSKAGTILNGRTVQTSRLRSGDTIVLGNTTLTFMQ